MVTSCNSDAEFLAATSDKNMIYLGWFWKKKLKKNVRVCLGIIFQWSFGSFWRVISSLKNRVEYFSKPKKSTFLQNGVDHAKPLLLILLN